MQEKSTVSTQKLILLLRKEIVHCLYRIISTQLTQLKKVGLQLTNIHFYNITTNQV